MLSRVLKSLGQTVFTVVLLLCATSRSEAVEVVFLGDSNTWIGGDTCDDPRGWNCHFARRDTTLSCHSYARSGATWTANRNSRVNVEQNVEVLADDNIIFNQIKRLENDVMAGIRVMPDLIIVAAGTNDAWFETRRPDIYSVDADEAVLALADTLCYDAPGRYPSLAMSVRLGCEYLRKTAPRARLVVLTPLQSDRIDAKRLAHVSDIIEATAAGMGIEVIRQDMVCPVRGADEALRHTLPSDGIHTSPRGAREVGNTLFDIIFKNGRHGIL